MGFVTRLYFELKISNLIALFFGTIEGESLSNKATSRTYIIEITKFHVLDRASTTTFQAQISAKTHSQMSAIRIYE